MSRKARAVIDLDAIRHNYRLAKSMAPQGRALAVVKADAYGHGAVVVANALNQDADAFAVACVEEAVSLRENGIEKPILLLEGFFDGEDLKAVQEYNLWTAIHDLGQIESLKNWHGSQPTQAWLKIDTGMHRLGIPPELTRSAFEQLSSLPHISEVVLMTHFSCADELDNPATHDQIDCFNRACDGLNAARSMANSAGTLGWFDALADWQRPGLMLYGASPFVGSHPFGDKLRKAMSLRSEIIAVRDIPPGDVVGYGATWMAEQSTRVGTVAMGYGDGFHRQAISGTPVMVNGQMTKIIGRVSMDMITVDLTGLTGVNIGSDVEFWGETLTLDEVAPWYDSVPYTLTTCLTPRVHREYLNR
ncbi:alanine racemase [Hahella sp. CCB-MM4]|uniref:alanine racemase n=1 Tax=Hahella sp. (strain CCB-MM4) TaxID=1926491 RepID=UPI000B9A80B2|nr:alanine racemase [Hahella sp. CCB-MM4]OZG71906.1 alanine racemase [Hahella sp. CCB-MM4]